MSFITKTLSLIPFGFTRTHTPLCVTVRNYAARKGTREKARKKKGVKVEVKKQEFVPHNQRGLEKMLAARKSKKFDDSWKQIATDNVYPAKYYRWRVYPFEEAVQCHKETHHPTMYNEPDAPLKVIIELDMQGEKKTRFVENFNRVAPMPHPFDHGDERSLLVFTKESKLQEMARDAGAALVGGPELVKEIQTGALSLQDFQYIIAHPNILPELVSLRGLMKKKFPNPKNGTLNSEVVEAVKKYMHGIKYTAMKDEYEKDFGIIETTVGPLTMDAKQLEDNFRALITDIMEMKPKRAGIFIRRCLLVSPPCTERLKVDHNIYISTENVDNDDAEEEEEEEEQQAKA